MDLIRPDQVEASADTLAEAFRDDPLLEILQPDGHKRPRVGRWVMSTVVRYGTRGGQVWGNEDVSAVAIWLPPDGTDVSIGGMIRAGFGALPLKVGIRGVKRFMRLMSASEPLHKAVDGPHWYLMSVGTRPERQGQGLGSALLEVGTSQADAAGLPCYLETLTDEDVAFYSKRGFEVTGQAEVEGFILRAMVRPPK
jgi:ribosomal protein S18 acetylase RimI-like enzyme